MNLNELTPEQIERARACKTAEDLVKLAEEEGYELSDDELNAITGGGVEDWGCWTYDCGFDA